MRLARRVTSDRDETWDAAEVVWVVAALTVGWSIVVGSVNVAEPKSGTAAAPQEALQSMPATVRGRQYLGSKTSYRLDLGETLQVVAELHGPGHDGFAPGDRVSLGIDSALARVIAA